MILGKREQSIRLFDATAAYYDTWLNPFRIWLTYVQKACLKYISNGKLLDIGCGTGDLLLMLAKRGKCTTLYGIDISPNMVKKAKKNLAGRAVIQYGDAENIPFKSNFFDYVASTEAFHHYENPKRAVKEMHRVLKKGGHLLLADFSISGWLIRKLFLLVEPGHIKIYSRKEFSQLLRDAGFQIEEQKRIGLFAVLNIAKKKRKTYPSI